MNEFDDATVRCGCGHAYGARVARHLHVSRRPEVRQAIVEGSFHRFACPRCQRINVVEEVLPYTDFPRRHWFTLFPGAYLGRREAALALCRETFDKTMREHAPGLVRGWADEFVQRAVFGWAALRDKIVVLDAGLDDRLVEILKLRMFQSGSLVFEPGVYLCCTRVDKASLVFEYGAADSQTTTAIEVPGSEYARLVMDFDRLQPFCRRYFGDLFVDFRVALAPDAAAPARASGA